jgi:hypothetical protein
MRIQAVCDMPFNLTRSCLAYMGRKVDVRMCRLRYLMPTSQGSTRGGGQCCVVLHAVAVDWDLRALYALMKHSSLHWL